MRCSQTEKSMLFGFIFCTQHKNCGKREYACMQRLTGDCAEHVTVFCLYARLLSGESLWFESKNYVILSLWYSRCFVVEFKLCEYIAVHLCIWFHRCCCCSSAIMSLIWLCVSRVGVCVCGRRYCNFCNKLNNNRLIVIIQVNIVQLRIDFEQHK